MPASRPGEYRPEHYNPQFRAPDLATSPPPPCGPEGRVLSTLSWGVTRRSPRRCSSSVARLPVSRGATRTRMRDLATALTSTAVRFTPPVAGRAVLQQLRPVLVADFARFRTANERPSQIPRNLSLDRAFTQAASTYDTTARHDISVGTSSSANNYPLDTVNYGHVNRRGDDRPPRTNAPAATRHLRGARSSRARTATRSSPTSRASAPACCSVSTRTRRSSRRRRLASTTPPCPARDRRAYRARRTLIASIADGRRSTRPCPVSLEHTLTVIR